MTTANILSKGESVLKGTHFIALFVIHTAGVVSFGGPKSSPHSEVYITVKFLNVWTPEKFAVIYLNFKL